MISPYKGTFRVSQAFLNKRSNGTLHQGYDLVGISDKRIFSPVYGTVERAGWEAWWDHGKGFGQYVRIRIGNTKLRLYLGHLSSIAVRVGQTVRPGDLLGVEGSTGHSTGSHVHMEIRYGTAKHNYQSVSDWADIPNRADRGAQLRSDWGKGLLGFELLKPGRNRFPCNAYNSTVQSVVGVNADGLFGSNTTLAVKRFQAAHGLRQDGLVGPDTKRKMMEGVK